MSNWLAKQPFGPNWIDDFPPFKQNQYVQHQNQFQGFDNNDQNSPVRGYSQKTTTYYEYPNEEQQAQQIMQKQNLMTSRLNNQENENNDYETRCRFTYDGSTLVMDSICQQKALPYQQQPQQPPMPNFRQENKPIVSNPTYNDQPPQRINKDTTYNKEQQQTNTKRNPAQDLLSKQKRQAYIQQIQIEQQRSRQQDKKITNIRQYSNKLRGCIVALEVFIFLLIIAVIVLLSFSLCNRNPSGQTLNLNNLSIIIAFRNDPIDYANAIVFIVGITCACVLLLLLLVYLIFLCKAKCMCKLFCCKGCKKLRADDTRNTKKAQNYSKGDQM